MNVKTEIYKTILHVDSSDRDEGTISNFSVRIELPRNEVKFIELIRIEFPNIIPLIRTNVNDKLIFEDISGTNRTITIPQGNYTIRQLLDKIKTLMNAFNSGVFDLTYDVNSNKINISCNSNFKIFVNNSTILNLLGYTSTADMTGDDNYIGDIIFDLSGLNYVYVQTNLIHGLQNDKIMTTNKKVHNSYLSSLCKIPLTTSYGEIEYYEPPTKMRINTSHKQISNLSFRIVDKDGKNLILERDYSITLILYSQKPKLDFTYLSIPFKIKDKDKDKKR